MIAVGAATAFVLKGYGIDSQVASEEQSEGVAKIIQSIHETSYVLWPHSALSRPVINDTLIQRKIPFFSCPLYDTYPCKNSALPDLNQISEVLFSSPSTVKSFFTRIPRPPSHLKLTPIGSVTAEELAKYASFKEN